MSEKIYTILHKGKRYRVTHELYKAHFKDRERQRYQHSQINEFERSLERFEEDGVNAEYQYAMSQPSLEDDVLNNWLMLKLDDSILQLPEDEQQIIRDIFYEGCSERDVSVKIGVPQTTVSYRKRKILLKLKNILKNF